MNLMDMLSSEADPMYDVPEIDSVLDQEVQQSNGHVNVDQPQDGIYYVPTVLTKMQRDLMEYIVNIMSPELLKDIDNQDKRGNVHSLLGDTVLHGDDDDGDGNNQNGIANDSIDYGKELKINEIIEFLFEQLEIATNNPSLLVDHFLPKKLLLSETNEHLVSMSGKFQIFNRILNGFIDHFDKSIKFEDSPIYNMLVIASSVKELELIEGLIIGKRLYYNNVSTEKLFGKNIAIDDLKKQSPVISDIELEYKRKRKHKKVNIDCKPKLFLHLCTSSQLYNNYTPLLANSSVQFKTIFSFDNNLDTNCPSIELIRNSRLDDAPTAIGHQYPSQSQYAAQWQQQQQPLIPIIMPIPIYSINHYQSLSPPPEKNSMFSENNELNEWKRQMINNFMINRVNLFDDLDDDEEDISKFFINNYGKNMKTFYDWFISWDSLEYPFKNIWKKINDEKLLLNYSDERLMKSYQKSFVNERFSKIEKFDYKLFKSKFADLVHKRVNQINNEILTMKDKIEDFKLMETKRQLEFDNDEDLISENYKKLKRVNEDATFIEKKYNKVDEEFKSLTERKLKLTTKLNLFSSFRHYKLKEKLIEQQILISQLQEDSDNLSKEYNKINDDYEALKTNYQFTSTEVIQLTNEIKRLESSNDVMTKKLNLPGIKILPSLIKKDDKLNHELLLKKLEDENKSLTKFINNDLEKVINERNKLLANSTQGSSSRSINRMSRGSTPLN